MIELSLCEEMRKICSSKDRNCFFQFFSITVDLHYFSISAVHQNDPVFLIYIYTHIYIYIDTHSFSHIILQHVPSQVTRYIVPYTIQQDIIVYPLQKPQFASTNPKLPVHPTLSLSPLATTSLYSKSMSFFPFYRKFHFLLILDSRYK